MGGDWWGRPAWYVGRPALVASVPPRGLTVVAAPAGFGKSALAAEVAGTRGRPVVEVGLRSLDRDDRAVAARLLAAARHAGVLLSGTPAPGDVGPVLDALRRDQDLTVVLDDVHRAADAGPLLRTVVEALRHRHCVVVAGRVLPPGFDVEPDLTVGRADLELPPEGVADVVRIGFGVDLDPAAGAVLHALTAGWAAATVLAGPVLARANDPALAVAELAASGATVARLVERAAAELEPADRRALATWARLPLLGPELDGPLEAPGLFERARAVGLPLAERGSWWALPDPVSDHLRTTGPARPELLVEAARFYARAGEPVAAVDLLLEAGDAQGAADVLDGLSPPAADRLDLSELRALCDRLPGAVVASRPSLLLHLARACSTAAALDDRAAYLESARRAVEAVDPAARPALRRAVVIEQAYDDLALRGDLDGASAAAEAVRAEIGPDEVLTQARAFEVLGRAAAWTADDAGLRRAAELFRSAAHAARRSGHASITQVVLTAAGWAVELARGRHEQALALLDEAVTRPGRPRQRAMVQTFRAEALHELGRDADATAALEEAAELGRRLDDDRLVGYAAWERARGAARRGDRAATLQHLRTAEHHGGDWFVHATGMELLADAADCCARVGEAALAAEYLARARERMAELGSQEISVWMATAAVECRVGEARAALDAADVAAGLPGLAPRHRWRPMLLRAVAAHRLGREDAADLAAAAFEEAAATGVAALPAILEPDLTAILLPLAAVRSATAAAVLGAGTAIEVDVLGGFTVTVGGSAVDLPAGRPTHLLKLLAVRGGQESVDVVIDELWPDAAPDRGRPLLRNVLHRLRRDTGHELVVRAGERLSLLPGTVVDLARFEDLSGRARHGGTDAVAAARAAVGAYRGPLLPDDLYEPWTALPREHARRELLAALDVLAADAEARADVDAAVDVLEQAIAEDPDGDHRYLRAARLLAAAGRPGLALAMLDRAAAALAQLGLAPPVEHQALRRTL